jgi:hypothetical protein
MRALLIKKKKKNEKKGKIHPKGGVLGVKKGDFRRKIDVFDAKMW